MHMPTTNNTSSPVVTITGRGKAKRLAAYGDIAPQSFAEQMSRQELIATLNVALGAKPSEREIKAARVEYQIGRVAARMDSTCFPKGCKSPEQRLAFARELVLHYAVPAKAGVKVRELKPHQTGRRNAAQHKAVRAADEAWSQIKAELGLGAAQTQRLRNAAKRNPAPHHKGKGKGEAPSHAELVKPAAPTSANDACTYVETQCAALLAYANKNAKIMPAAYGSAIQTFKTAINKLANERALEGK
jgi:hypothetical protein